MEEVENFTDFAGFQPRQIQAWESIQQYKYLLYGGAAGGGKSYFLRWCMIGLLLHYFKHYRQYGIRVGLFCEDYPALRDRQLSRIPYEFPEWLGHFNKSEHDFVLNDEYGGGILSFRNLDDVSKYLSAEFAAVGVDELTKNKREVFDFLNLRMRWPLINDTKFIGCTNPGDIGHGWVKKLWINSDFDGETFDPREFGFVPAKYTDNKFIDPSYAKQLDSLPDSLRRAYKEGDWDTFAGQYFTEFRRERHVIEPFNDEKTIEWFGRLDTYCGLDYGFAKPSAVVWGKYHDGTWYIFRELYQKGLDYPALAAQIWTIQTPKLIFADPSIWAKKDSPTSGADKMKPLPLKEGMNDRIIGWNLIRTLLREDKIKIFNTCTNLIRTFPEAVYDETKVEDMDTNGDDHLLDSLRYMIATHRYVEQQRNSFTYSPRNRIMNKEMGGSEIEQAIKNPYGTSNSYRLL